MTAATAVVMDVEQHAALPFPRSLLGIAGNTTAPTYAELYSGDWAHPTSSGRMC